MSLQQLRNNIDQRYCTNEDIFMSALRTTIHRTDKELEDITSFAKQLSVQALQQQNPRDNLQALLQEYQLSSDEGLALMTLTESLLRIPDQSVASRLIADRTRPLNWQSHLHSDSPFMVNASTLMLMLTGKMLSTSSERPTENHMHRLLRRVSQPLIHAAMKKVIDKISEQFIFAEDIRQALTNINQYNNNDYFSLDMLGESALSQQNAHDFYQKYHAALAEINHRQLQNKASISIKLSALHPRYEYRHQASCIKTLSQTLTPLMKLANQHNIDLTIDAEEADRQTLGLDVFQKLFTLPSCGKSTHIGLAVQAYSPRALALLKYLKHLSECSGRKISVRLVKGAYWDSEIKQAQVEGLDYYPVFTQKHHTELCYLACADFLLNNRQYFYPQFATHNAVTICDILSRAEPDNSFEFQRLYGMGEHLYTALRTHYPNLNVRIYGPVGQHKELLPYLVRRVLENGANNSFLKQLLSPDTKITQLCLHPVLINESSLTLPLPDAIYLSIRRNSQGFNLANTSKSDALMQKLEALKPHIWENDVKTTEPSQNLVISHTLSPYDEQLVGTCHQFDKTTALEQLNQAHDYFSTWRKTNASERANILLNYAKILQAHQGELVSLLIRESGKTIPDSLNEVREAIDFAYYYAQNGLTLFTQSNTLPSVTGEKNTLELRGRGVFLCISPWNFPLAIFSGQLCAALMAGNTVIAKPAARSTLIARFAVDLLYQAGLPKKVLYFTPGRGSQICPALCTHAKISGVAFTGSTETAQNISQALTQRTHGIIPFIAETGGQNVMIIDSSALPEQVVKDVIQSAFYTAGQRCSALRVLYLQEETANSIISLLKGAMAELSIGDPAKIDSDIGPVISTDAKDKLKQHIKEMKKHHKLIFACKLHPEVNSTNLVAPHVFEINHITDLEEEHFGPILHIITYEHKKIKNVIDEINQYGYGLTCGIHSRNEVWATSIANDLNVGNIYINRNIIGAIVGSQPFGGQGLSGTGPKAGGPNYLPRFATETCISNNIAAIGGNIALITK
jgi:RHH-type proline utilization regulon transcriptional repressor/proline dehydrogenase/delta 1-pyrroline-5-carboxylate dehydrogenase